MRLRSPLSSVPSARADGQAADADFRLDSWLKALRDLGDDRGWQRPGIGEIHANRALDRACRVVGMVTLCAPNGFGDLILNLKDPSGTIDASVHKKVISNENFSKSLSVGSIVFLKQVAVLRPSNTVCYLNVTQKNVEKVLQKGIVFPCKQVTSERQSQQPDQGDNIERQAGAESSDGMTAILSKISRTKESQMAELLSANGGAVQSSTEDIMRKLIGGETMMSSSKEITVAEGSRHHCGTPDASMDTDARCNSEKPQEIGLEKMVEGHSREHVSNINRDEHQQQIQSANTRCPQPILGESSVMSSSRDSTQASCTGNLGQLSDDDWMQPSRKKQKSDAIVPDGNGARMNGNINTLSMGAETKYGLENNLNTGLDDTITEEFHSDHDSIGKFEHEQDLHAVSLGTLQPSQENSSISATSGTSLRHNKMVAVAPVAEWTDEQLSELFADY